jgi:hypothetical protein
VSVERDQSNDAKKLTDDEARRLLARATEIESAQSAQLSLAELREVALEANIAPNAFDQALVELDAAPSVPDSQPMQQSPKVRSRFATGLLSTAKTVGIVIATLTVLMILVDLL